LLPVLPRVDIALVADAASVLAPCAVWQHLDDLPGCARLFRADGACRHGIGLAASRLWTVRLLSEGECLSALSSAIKSRSGGVPDGRLSNHAIGSKCGSRPRSAASRTSRTARATSCRASTLSRWPPSRATMWTASSSRASSSCRPAPTVVDLACSQTAAPPSRSSGHHHGGYP
jgi:hypothetical protein